MFTYGVFAKAVRSELTLPKDLYSSLSIYLLLALGLKGGVELSESSIHAIAWPAAATLLLGCITPVSAYFFLRRVGRFSSVDAAGMAAHYGSVSAVTFIAATQFTANMGSAAEGFMPTLLTLLESPGIHIALAIGALKRAKLQKSVTGQPGKSKSVILHEILTARSMILLVGGLVIGLLMGIKGYEPIKPFFETGFKGALVLFLLEMGIIAGARLKDLRVVGFRIVAFGLFLPLLHGSIGVLLGHFAGLSVGGASVLGAMAASASYIAAPPAVRMTLPEANPAYYLTASLAVTFPFNLVVRTTRSLLTSLTRISFAELNFRMNLDLLQTRYLTSTLSVLLLFSGCASTSAPRQETPADALSKLKEGNARFISGKVRTDGQSKMDIERLSTGQAPQAIVLSCSDSRVPPETVFDQKLGEMFTVRSAGEALSSQAIASIEFAIAKPGSKLIVVMGHTKCGAIKAAVDTLSGGSAGSENLDQLVNDIKPRLSSQKAGKTSGPDLAEESLANAKGVARDLMERSKIISAAVDSGKVKIAVALYQLKDGIVHFE